VLWTSHDSRRHQGDENPFPSSCTYLVGIYIFYGNWSREAFWNAFWNFLEEGAQVKNVLL
jgi:hypothetical protein